MSPESLMSHFERIIDAPDAIPAIRSFVLDLAVRGKLVDQDSADESASELLERIKSQKARLAKEGVKPIRTEPIDPEAVLFPVPRGWQLVRLGSIAQKLGAGSTPLGGKSVYQRTGVPFIRSQNVHDDGLRLDDVALIPRAIHDAMSGTHVRTNDILLNITGASIGRCALVPSDFAEGNVSQHVAIIRLIEPAIREFIHLSLISPVYQKLIMDVQVGVSREGLSMQRLKEFPVVLPPVAEQRRIVKNVRELMAFCEKLERSLANREKRRNRLVAATLHGLKNGEVSAESGGGMSFDETSRFYFNHLPRFTSRPEHIQQLRHSVLNLAVSGRLVAQDPSDEPIEILRGKIEAERRRQQEAGHIRIRASMGDPSISQAPYRLPASWTWVYLGTLVLDSESGWSPQCEAFPRTGSNWGVVKVSAVSWNEFDPTENKQLLPGVVPREEARIHRGDFLISRANTSELVAKCAIVRQQPVNLMMSDKIVRLRLSKQVNPDFVRFVNNHADYARAYYAEEASGTSLSMKNVSRDVIYRLFVPLPPLAEQNRIVAKVEELTCVCNELEAQFKNVASTRRALLEATLQEALGRAESAKAVGAKHE